MKSLSPVSPNTVFDSLKLGETDKTEVFIAKKQVSSIPSQAIIINTVSDFASRLQKYKENTRTKDNSFNHLLFPAIAAISFAQIITVFSPDNNTSDESMLSFNISLPTMPTITLNTVLKAYAAVMVTLSFSIGLPIAIKLGVPTYNEEEGTSHIGF